MTRSRADTATGRSTPILVPTLTKQSWSFMIGSTLFAVGAAVAIWDLGSASLTNMLCFIGAWFFTAAGLMQTALSGAATTKVDYGTGRMFRAVWLAAAIQSIGTILFNVSTSGALSAHTVLAEERLVWNPDAGGSVAFLISAAFVYVGYFRERDTLWEPGRSEWWAAHINMLGCIAFGVSAVGAFILSDGSTENAMLANWGTLIGALCFFFSSAVVLPQLGWNRRTSEAESSTA
ncbi:MAG TPA: hypothetical protein H9755_01365 [Candidatus Dietzia intestinigallinarum]|nr:hypothetical protein [Candidatus Dietzia intestinigallinarum]